MVQFRRALIALAVSAALAVTGLTAASPASAAAGATLCKGWDGCEALGMTNHGYKSAAGTEYWKMVRGHNCTNYVAYMMISAGMSSTRPWVGNGNANAWGGANPQQTDGIPAVGSIAWWDAGQRGAGNAGHVSYVEQVFPDRIIVSEDNYGGDFYWRVIYNTDKNWPSGFVHLKDATTSASFPAWRGRPLEQSLYSDDAGTRSASVATLEPGASGWVTLTFQNTGDQPWVGTRVVTSGASSAIGGTGWVAPNTPAMQKQAAVVTGSTATYRFPVTIPAAPDGTQFAETFTVLDAAGTPIAYSTATTLFTADGRDAFDVQAPLGISGVGTQDQVLTTFSAPWSPVQPGYTQQWMRNGKPITGATLFSYKLTGADVGKRISVSTVASAPGFLPVAQSATWPTVIKSLYGNKLPKKKTLKAGAQLVSSNGVYRLLQGKSGSLAVVNRVTKKTVWSSKSRAAGAYTRVRSDGVLVTYSGAGKPIWNSKTKGKHASYALVTNSGKLALYTVKGKVVWTSSSAAKKK